MKKRRHDHPNHLQPSPAQFKALLNRAIDDREVIVVRRRSGGAVAMIAADELQGLMETAHLLRSPQNATRLLAALHRARRATCDA